MLWYMLKQKQQRKRNKQTESNNYFRRTFMLNYTKSRIDFLANLFYFCPFCFCFCFFPFFSLFLFLSPFLSFFSLKYWGGPSRPCRHACYAPVMNTHFEYVNSDWLLHVCSISRVHECIDNKLQFHCAEMVIQNTSISKTFRGYFVHNFWSVPSKKE